ncbi:efflux RND transporter permease subunit, partial [Acinetobacter baumannii]|uniref:efflux RND transporter permease subunit n=1 Tax=Acinetobacter baumannii TaxID=470 RepID=UPI003AF668DA
TVAHAVDAKIKEIQSNLPKGLEIETVYDRTSLVYKAIATVQKNLVEGAILVIVILFIFLGNFRAALFTACVIRLSMLFSLSGIDEQNISA